MKREGARVALYAGGALFAMTLAGSALVLVRQGVKPLTAAEVSVIPSVVLTVIALASRFPCSAMPLRTTGFTRLLTAHLASAIAAGGLWVALWNWWLPVMAGGSVDVPVTLAVGAFLYAVTVTIQYLVLEVEAARSAEAAALRFQVLASEAELRAFKAQIDPHFLFNSLNSVASLCGSEPAAARRMAQLLADFFRQTLKLGALDRIRLEDEIELVSRYLAIEQVRFGERLKTNIEVDEGARDCTVPPLILQPLVENAVRHGIASLVEGGTVGLSATKRDGVLRIRVENPADPDRDARRGEGIGLQNARGRLALVTGGRAAVTTEESNGRFRVDIEMPA
ncbi:MAG: histidine kinase [Thermoanaerobaculia bacterium]